MSFKWPNTIFIKFFLTFFFFINMSVYRSDDALRLEVEPTNCVWFMHINWECHKSSTKKKKNHWVNKRGLNGKETSIFLPVICSISSCCNKSSIACTVQEVTPPCCCSDCLDQTPAEPYNPILLMCASLKRAIFSPRL